MVRLAILRYTWLLPPSFACFALLSFYFYSPTLIEIPNVILLGKVEDK